MKINLLYSIITDYRYTIDVDEYFDEEEYGKPWEELTEDEKADFLYEIGIDLMSTAENDCSEYSLGEYIGFEDDEDCHYL